MYSDKKVARAGFLRRSKKNGMDTLYTDVRSNKSLCVRRVNHN